MNLCGSAEFLHQQEDLTVLLWDPWPTVDGWLPGARLRVVLQNGHITMVRGDQATVGQRNLMYKLPARPTAGVHCKGENPLAPFMPTSVEPSALVPTRTSTAPILGWVFGSIPMAKCNGRLASARLLDWDMIRTIHNASQVLGNVDLVGFHPQFARERLDAEHMVLPDAFGGGQHGEVGRNL